MTHLLITRSSLIEWQYTEKCNFRFKKFYRIFCCFSPITINYFSCFTLCFQCELKSLNRTWVLISLLDSLKPSKTPTSAHFYGKLRLNFHLHRNFLCTQKFLSAQHWQKIRWREGNENSKFLKNEDLKIIGSYSQTPITAEMNIFNTLSEEGAKNLSITTVTACTVVELLLQAHKCSLDTY